MVIKFINTNVDLLTKEEAELFLTNMNKDDSKYINKELSYYIYLLQHNWTKIELLSYLKEELTLHKTYRHISSNNNSNSFLSYSRNNNFKESAAYSWGSGTGKKKKRKKRKSITKQKEQEPKNLNKQDAEIVIKKILKTGELKCQ